MQEVTKNIVPSDSALGLGAGAGAGGPVSVVYGASGGLPFSSGIHDNGECLSVPKACRPS